MLFNMTHSTKIRQKTFVSIYRTANEIIGKHRRIKKPWVTSNILDLCDKGRELKKQKGDTEGREIYKKVNTEIRNVIKKRKINGSKSNASAMKTT